MKDPTVNKFVRVKIPIIATSAFVAFALTRLDVSTFVAFMVMAMVQALLFSLQRQ